MIFLNPFAPLEDILETQEFDLPFRLFYKATSFAFAPVRDAVGYASAGLGGMVAAIFANFTIPESVNDLAETIALESVADEHIAFDAEKAGYVTTLLASHFAVIQEGIKYVDFWFSNTSVSPNPMIPLVAIMISTNLNSAYRVLRKEVDGFAGFTMFPMKTSDNNPFRADQSDFYAPSGEQEYGLFSRTEEYIDEPLLREEENPFRS